MKTPRRTGYEIYDLSRKIARRVQREREQVENPARPAIGAGLAPVIPFAPRAGLPPPGAPKAA
jgi:hypothetical protein